MCIVLVVYYTWVPAVCLSDSSYQLLDRGFLSLMSSRIVENSDGHDEDCNLLSGNCGHGGIDGMCR